MSVKVISFDLDGTLVDHSFADGVWLEGMAELYAEKRGIPFEEAQRELLKLYGEVSDERVEWYDLHYWFRRLGLPGSPEDLMGRYRERVRPFPEVRQVLEELKGRFYLVLFSNGCRPFMEEELKASGLWEYFDGAFSSVTDFGRVKDPEAYRRLCRTLGVEPKEVIHVGDNLRFDYLYPSSAGIRSFHLVRGKGGPGAFRDLTDLLGVVGDGAHRGIER